MQKNLTKIQFLTNSNFNESEFLSLKSMVSFDKIALEYLNELSKRINKIPNVREFPDVATFGFFCRKANLTKYKNEQISKESEIAVGRGVAFHISPSNVPINFAYSFVCGLLAGNTNIIRVPSKPFKQIEIICNSINEINSEPEWKFMSTRNHFVSYDKLSNATEYFSSICDIRIIWGGDNTIENIRKSKLKSRAFDVTFADRYSLSVINANEYLNLDNKKLLALGFYNDTYLFDQNACTSPHLIVWIGNSEQIKDAKELFWQNLREKVINDYNITSITGVDKLTKFMTFAATHDTVLELDNKDNYIWRVELNKLSSDIYIYRGNCGYFMEYSSADLSILSTISNNKFQTLSYFGFDKSELREFILNNIPKGIDRIVPIGKTTDFSLNWDGYKLIEHLSRVLEIK